MFAVRVLPAMSRAVKGEPVRVRVASRCCTRNTPEDPSSAALEHLLYAIGSLHDVAFRMFLYWAALRSTTAVARPLHLITARQHFLVRTALVTYLAPPDFPLIHIVLANADNRGN
jgi:hypothetical protein